MPKRKEIITPGEIYHIYNKSIASEDIFLGNVNTTQALKRVKYYKFKRIVSYTGYLKNNPNIDKNLVRNNNELNPLIDIFAYGLMPNHFHFVIRELIANGLKKFISNFQISFSKFHNMSINRNGALFQGRFKIQHITSIEQLLHVVRYVHLNPVTAYMYDFKKLSKSNLTSYHEYLIPNKNSITDTEFVLKQFSNIKSFIDFHKNQVDYQRKLASIKKLLID